MRSTFKLLPLAVAAALALCAFGASGASAEESKPRLRPAPKEKGIPFTGTGGRAILYGARFVGESPIDCTSTSLAGEFVTAKTIANTVLTISGCKQQSGWEFGNKCDEEATTIKSEPLSGELGYLNDTSKSKPIVGLMLGKEFKKEIKELKEVPRPTWDANMCESFGASTEQGPIRGESIGEITPVNTVVLKGGKGYTLVIEGKASEPAEPEWTKFEGGLEGQRLFWFVGQTERKLSFELTEEVTLTNTSGSEIEA
jgi:hypothetical protein